MPKSPDLSKVPNEVLLAEMKERRAELGPYWTMKKFRKCKGCGKVFSAREMRSHPCRIAWPKR